MRKLSDLYIVLSEAFLIFQSTTLCVDLTWIVNAKKITTDEFKLLIKDFENFKPEGSKKGDHWFKDRAERIEFLKNRIDNLKAEGL